MTASNHYSTIRIEVVQGKIGHRSWHHSNVYDIAPGRHQAFQQRITVIDGAKPHITAHGERFAPFTADAGADGFAYEFYR